MLLHCYSIQFLSYYPIEAGFVIVFLVEIALFDARLFNSAIGYNGLINALMIRLVDTCPHLLLLERISDTKVMINS